MTFYEWLNSKLQNMQLTRTEFAAAANVGYQTLHPWRLNEYDPNMLTMLRIVRAVANITKQPFNDVLADAVQYTRAYKQVTNNE